MKELTDDEIDKRADRIAAVARDPAKAFTVRMEKTFEMQLGKSSSNTIEKITSRIQEAYKIDAAAADKLNENLMQYFIKAKASEIVERLQNSNVTDFDAESKKQFEGIRDGVNTIERVMSEVSALVPAKNDRNLEAAFKKFGESTKKIYDTAEVSEREREFEEYLQEIQQKEIIDYPKTEKEQAKPEVAGRSRSGVVTGSRPQEVRTVDSLIISQDFKDNLNTILSNFKKQQPGMTDSAKYERLASYRLELRDAKENSSAERQKILNKSISEVNAEIKKVLPKPKISPKMGMR